MVARTLYFRRVGWTIITQRLTAIRKDIIAQCHTKFIGRGMGIGSDRRLMQSILGDDGLVTYDHLTLQGGYFWLVKGHQVNYGMGEQYMAFETFGGDATEAIMKQNPQIWDID
ncbi:MAG: ATP-binding protein [Symploca sp. SIO2E6]|nr:ATP-binding protein [Symploca sp. SIO2E6]